MSNEQRHRFPNAFGGLLFHEAFDAVPEQCLVRRQVAQLALPLFHSPPYDLIQGILDRSLELGLVFRERRR